MLEELEGMPKKVKESLAPSGTDFPYEEIAKPVIYLYPEKKSTENKNDSVSMITCSSLH